MPSAKKKRSAKARQSDFKFFETLRVRYAEVDPQGIVFNAHYLTYLDVAITEYFRARTGQSYNDLVIAHGIDFHVQQSLVDYHSSARFDDVLQIGVRGSYRGARIVWQLAIFRGSELVCSARLTYAGVESSTAKRGGVKRIPRGLAASLDLARTED
ncbi:MAG: acyl-CoA thioesterase [bacterium]|nr:acyl-CoA thioesterase [bacterium]